MQMTAWIQLKVEIEGEDGSVITANEVRKAFNSRMMEVFQGSELDEIIEEMFAHMNIQVENPALVNNRFVFDRVLFLDINFHKLNLTRHSSYLPFPDSISSKKAVINPKNEVRKAFNSRMMEVFQGSELDEIIEEMFAHMNIQVENPALVNNRFVFDRVLFLDINFHKLNLTRHSSYLPFPDSISSKKAVINPKNEEDIECFKWARIMALDHKGIETNLQ